MFVRAIQQTDAADWERMREALWPAAAGEHAGEIELFFEAPHRNPTEVLLAIEESGRAIGFAELSLRPYAEGCHTGRVAYLEGWFVEGSARRQGVGRALVSAGENWARAQGCTELASDTEIGNAASACAHGALGFEEVDRIICFRKAL